MPSCLKSLKEDEGPAHPAYARLTCQSAATDTPSEPLFAGRFNDSILRMALESSEESLDQQASNTSFSEIKPMDWTNPSFLIPPSARVDLVPLSTNNSAEESSPCVHARYIPSQGTQTDQSSPLPIKNHRPLPQSWQNPRRCVSESDTEGCKAFIDNNFPPSVEESNKNAALIGGPTFAKLLVRPTVADLICTNLSCPSTARALLGSATMVVSPSNCYFPGTSDRVISITTNDLSELLHLCEYVIGVVFGDIASTTGCGLTLREGKGALRIAAPRRIIGTIIGKRGLHVQSLRQNTTAHIHISPLFVSAEAACSERLITLTSRDKMSLEKAVETLIIQINKHPDRALAPRVIYAASRVKTVTPHIFRAPLVEDTSSDYEIFGLSLCLLVAALFSLPVGSRQFEI